jgi:uncharacterized protein (DUF885 family)
MSDIHPIETVVDAVGYIDRLNASKVQMEQVAEALRRSSDRGIIPTQIGVDIASWQINNQLTGAANHPLVTDFVSRLESAGLDQSAISDLETQAVSAVRDAVIPGYESLRDAVNELEPRSDTVPGVNNLPKGADYYSAILRHYVSTDITPDEAHDLGLTQVDRLRGEVTDALEASGYDVADLGFAAAVRAAANDAGSTALNTDADRAEFLDATRILIERQIETFAPMFESFPSTPFEVVRPRPGREGGSGAYYNAPPLDGSRPGLYYLSLAASEFPMLTYPTTNFHEAVPGHHLQLAIQRESKDLPLLQRALTFSGFAEGWGLYAERLAFEAGVYDDDPVGNMGRLRMELLRAARVVADTGIHLLGWSRQEAIDYLTNLGFTDSDASAEVDRYIVWPGQAPSYMIGMLEILRLREEAQQALGSEFNLAEFHTEILRHGSVPVSVLDDVIENWISAHPG